MKQLIYAVKILQSVLDLRHSDVLYGVLPQGKRRQPTRCMHLGPSRVVFTTLPLGAAVFRPCCMQLLHQRKPPLINDQIQQ